MSVIRMKKVTLIAPKREEDACLESVQSSGLMHISALKISTEFTGEIESLELRIAKYKRAIALLVKTKRQASPGKRQHKGMDSLVDMVCQIDEAIQYNRSRIKELDREIQKLDPFGPYEIADVKELATNGQHLFFAIANRKF